MSNQTNHRTLRSIDLIAAELQELLGDRFSTNRSVCENHGHDESWHATQSPDAVCFVETADEVSRILALCNRHEIPVIPFGTGTGMEGQVCATTGGICIDLSRMNAILNVNTDDFDCTVQAGVTRKQLASHLRDTGLFFSVDPGADASLGGMAATRASGTTTVRYGTMRENVVRLTVVMADGRVVTTGGRSRKSAAGYDLTNLIVGSEGTLGIIVELTLKLHALPEATSSATVSFDDIESAVQAVVVTMKNALPMARIEFMDAAQMLALNRYSKTGFAEKPTLFVEFHGSAASVEEQAQLFGEICGEFGGQKFTWTANTEEHNRLWSLRHNAAYAAKAMRPGADAIATDVCVPISRLAECIELTQRDADQNSSLQTMIAGHVGDGNFHFVFLVDRSNPEEVAAVEKIADRLVYRALEVGGTCTGEHGIGIGKKKYLMDEFGAETVRVMCQIKVALDPKNILNPGKKLP